MKRAQIANEFLILLGLGIIFLLAFLYAISAEISDINFKKEEYAARDIGLSVQNELFLASTVNDGYYREFKLLNKHNGVAYSIDIEGRFLYVETSKTKQLFEFHIPQVQGNIKKGNNSISKTGGVIYLN